MLRFGLRALGFLLLAVAFAAIVVDGTRSIAGRELSVFSLGDTIGRLKPGWIAALDQAVERVGAPAGRAAAAFVLATPTWLDAAVLGVLLLVAGRRPRRRIGYSGRDR